MNTNRSWLAALALVAAPAAQERPGPAVEVAAVAPVLTAHEAFAFAYGRRIAAGRQAGLHGGAWELPGYAPVEGTVPWHAGGTRPFAVHGADAQLLYLVPTTEDPSTRRAFCIRSDGAMAWTDNEVGARIGTGEEFQIASVLGQGGAAVASNFPRTPTRGRDGNLWLPGDLIRTTRIAVRVVDEAGVPMGLVEVSLIPKAPPYELAAALPAGRVTTLLEGDAVIQGAPARGLGVALDFGVAQVAVEAAQVEVSPGSLRITVPTALITRFRINTNESAAIATLKNISSGQAQCQACGVIDENQNGIGEYGTFAEMSGRAMVRGGKVKIQPPVLSVAFGDVEHGVVVRSGYCFRVWLPGKDGAPVGESEAGGLPAPAIDAKAAETLWCVYAWPAEAGRTGQRAFFLDQSGNVHGCLNTDGRYSGSKAPAPDAVREPGSNGTLAAPAATNATGIDGQTWVIIS
jgi:hypothetical protein